MPAAHPDKQGKEKKRTESTEREADTALAKKERDQTGKNRDAENPSGLDKKRLGKVKNHYIHLPVAACCRRRREEEERHKITKQRRRRKIKKARREYKRKKRKDQFIGSIGGKESRPTRGVEYLLPQGGKKERKRLKTAERTGRPEKKRRIKRKRMKSVQESRPKSDRGDKICSPGPNEFP